MQTLATDVWLPQAPNPNFCPCVALILRLTPLFDLQLWCDSSLRLLRYSANTRLCYCSLLHRETAGLFHRSRSSIKLLRPDRLCWWINVILLLSVGFPFPERCLRSLKLWLCPSQVKYSAQNKEVNIFEWQRMKGVSSGWSFIYTACSCYHFVIGWRSETFLQPCSCKIYLFSSLNQLLLIQVFILGQERS